jgi:hypothetical protein
MDGQTWITLSAAGACGIWAAWRFVKPFLNHPDSSCGTSCATPADQDQLMQIRPLGRTD